MTSLLTALVLLTSCLTITVHSWCPIAEEGQATNITCPVHNTSCPQFTWLAETDTENIIFLTTSDVLTLETVSRSEPFNMATRWLCGQCSGESHIACDPLVVFASAAGLLCELEEETDSGEVTAVTVSCSTNKIYPQGLCEILLEKNRTCNYDMSSGIDYSHTDNGESPVYYSSQCSVTVSLEEIGEGAHVFRGSMRPNQTMYALISNTTEEFTLSFSLVAHNCTWTGHQGDTLGHSAICICFITNEGYPRGTARWYAENATQPLGDDGVLHVNYDANFAEQVFTCEAVSALGRKVGSTLDVALGYMPYATLPEVKFAINSTETTFNIGESLVFTCSAHGDPEPTSVILTRAEPDEILADVDTPEVTYILDSLDCLDTGVYVCAGENYEGTSSKNISIAVRCPQQPSNPTPSVSAAVGGTAQTTIEVYGFPEPSLFILRQLGDPTDLAGSSRYDVTYTVAVAPFGVITITIFDLLETDFTNYTLTADNGVGEPVTFTFYLQETAVSPEGRSRGDGKDDPMNTTFIIVGVIAGVFVVAVVVAVVVVVVLKRRQQPPQRREAGSRNHQKFPDSDPQNLESDGYLVPIPKPAVINSLGGRVDATRLPRPAIYNSLDPYNTSNIYATIEEVVDSPGTPPAPPSRTIPGPTPRVLAEPIYSLTPAQGLEPHSVHSGNSQTPGPYSTVPEPQEEYPHDYLYLRP